MVISLLERMRSENVIPNTIVLTAAIDSLAREGGGAHTGDGLRVIFSVVVVVHVAIVYWSNCCCFYNCCYCCFDAI